MIEKSHVTVQIEAALAKMRGPFTFAELFANTNLNESSHRAAINSLQHLVFLGKVLRVGTTGQVATYRTHEVKAKADSETPARGYTQLTNCDMLTPPSRDGALDYMGCPSLMDGRRVPYRPPISGMVTEVASTSKSGLDARRLLF